MNSKPGLAHLLCVLAALVCLHPAISSSSALFLGLACALTCGNPFAAHSRLLTPKLLQISIVALGAGMNLSLVAEAGIHGFGYTASGILLTSLLGLGLGALLRVNRDVSLLLTMGTAICGGSAIAAVASTINAKPAETSLALACVFFLNALALFIFPPLGHFFGLSEYQFGLWSALAIHDTSSVVGSALAYGPRALTIATTVKLARALWIMPLCLLIGYWYQQTATKKPSRPWFILGFIVVAGLVSWLPSLAEPGKIVYTLASRSLVFTLFLMGANLSRSSLREKGVRPLLQGFILWVLVAGCTLGAIHQGYLR